MTRSVINMLVLLLVHDRSPISTLVQFLSLSVFSKLGHAYLRWLIITQVRFWSLQTELIVVSRYSVLNLLLEHCEVNELALSVRFFLKHLSYDIPCHWLQAWQLDRPVLLRKSTTAKLVPLTRSTCVVLVDWSERAMASLHILIVFYRGQLFEHSFDAGQISLSRPA